MKINQCTKNLAGAFFGLGVALLFVAQRVQITTWMKPEDFFIQLYLSSEPVAAYAVTLFCVGWATTANGWKGGAGQFLFWFLWMVLLHNYRVNSRTEMFSAEILLFMSVAVILLIEGAKRLWTVPSSKDGETQQGAA